MTSSFSQPPATADPTRKNQTMSQGQSRTRIGVMLAVTTAGVAMGVAGYFLYRGMTWYLQPLYLLAAIFVIDAALTLFSSWFFTRQKTIQGISVLLIANSFALIAVSVLLTNAGIMAALIILVVTLISVAEVAEPKDTTGGIILGVAGSMIALLANTYSPVAQLYLPAIQPVFPIILVILLIVYAILFIWRFSRYSLQVKLITILLASVLIPLVIVVSLYTSSMRSAVIDRADQALMVSASQAASSVDTFISNNTAAIRTESQLPALTTFLELPADQRAGSDEEKEVSVILNTLKSKDRMNIMSYALVDNLGKDVFDTVASNIGQDEKEMVYFSNPITSDQAYASPVLFKTNSNRAYIYFSAPVMGTSGDAIGVLRVQYDAVVLQQLVNQFFGVTGANSFAILFDENYMRLADSGSSNLAYKVISSLTQDRMENLQAAYRLPKLPIDQLTAENPALLNALRNRNTQRYFTVEAHQSGNHPEMGAVAGLKTQVWSIAFLQDESVILAPITGQTRLLMFIVSLIAAATAAAAIGLAYLFTSPISSLLGAVQQISAGQYSARTHVRSRDEIGTLGNAFNKMAEQLDGLIVGLEQAVQERTRELSEQTVKVSYRANQLQAVSEVARTIASVQDLETLLTSVARVISDRFGFYHVGIFLIDENHEFAVLRAANSVGGEHMLTRNHRLRVGQVGIVGHVAGSGEARIVTDVGEDAIYFNNPDLPETRSEMALPLKFGHTIIGVLDVQSTVSDAFMEEDIALFTTLADQVAIAIENNRLFAEMNQALSEARDLHRQYLLQAWNEEEAYQGQKSFHYTIHGLNEEPPTERPEISAALRTGEICTAEDPGAEDHGSGKLSMAVPIKMRGITIGVIDLQDSGEKTAWGPDEIAMVQSVADQVALALENARLFEQMVRRADRERKVLEITGKIRSTNDPQEMLKAAAEELKRVLRTNRAQVVIQKPLAVTDQEDGREAGENLEPNFFEGLNDTIK